VLRRSLEAGRCLTELCQEGVARHGDDLAQIVGYVRRRIDDLPAEEKASLLDELSLLLGDHVPLRGLFSSH
jgi:hypothetical protein